MAKIANFVYSMIIFLSLFLVATKAEFTLFILSFFVTRYYPCNTDSDCPQNMCTPDMEPRCWTGYCSSCYIRWGK
ncbi:Nodule Cysteine-Rich (NCR) secreted peptide [Medicago truncatula]|uniref:Nodule Cysteine-Rich (NCR) secreted peptide n=1 Tax=Medicago truncatula TaxID=3880 RepID=A0A072TQ08_MEDTR|nr:Nodule Cysteine-Rich (NCR) secreted peptide [Medicago truncatula]